MTPRILIAGAGPAGLVAAIELYRRGIPVRIIDKAEGFANHSRAIGINPRTLQILTACGATDQLIAEGTKIVRACMHWPKGRTAGLELSRLDGPHPYMLALPQSRTERILSEVLLDLGGKVEHGTALVDLEQDDQSVRCLIEGPEGASSFEATHLIGADGFHSLAREQAGIDFAGESLDHDWTIADVAMDWPFPLDELHVIFGKGGFLLTITLGGDRFRIVSPNDTPEAWLPKNATIKQEIWRSTFRVHHRQASTYQAGQVFLAGDAAHVHSPIGARGMNMGIADAATLAWLIAESREAEYNSIRHPVGARTIRMVKRQTMQAVASKPLQRRLAALIAPVVLGFPPIQRYAARFVAGLTDRKPAWL